MSKIAWPTPAPPKGKVVRGLCEAVGACAVLFFARLEMLAKSMANFALMAGGATKRLCIL